MARETFVDTSGFYALLVQKDDRHEEACRMVREAALQKNRFVTTDYVLGETATLLKARHLAHLLDVFFEIVLSSPACLIEWTDAARFQDVQAYFLKHLDQSWSFTDCLSFRVMRDLRLRDAFTKDIHFEQAGFTALLK